MFSRPLPKRKTLNFLNSRIPNTLRGQHVTRLSTLRAYSTTSLRKKQIASNTPTSKQPSLTYSFPNHCLRTTLNDSTKNPVVLVSCGSFSPITYLHLQMFEMASDFIKLNTKFELMGGYLSPVSDAYKKQGLSSSAHRLRMCELAANEKKDGNVTVDTWEALQPEYTPTAQVLDHFNYEINEVLEGAENTDGTRVPMRIMLLAGADLVQTFSTPSSWTDEDLQHILGDYGLVVVKRKGTDIDQALESLERWKENIYITVPPTINDVSSTKIRLHVKKGQSIRYLTPDPVVDYIEKNGLYRQDRLPPAATGED